MSTGDYTRYRATLEFRGPKRAYFNRHRVNDVRLTMGEVQGILKTLAQLE